MLSSELYTLVKAGGLKMKVVIHFYRVSALFKAVQVIQEVCIHFLV